MARLCNASGHPARPGSESFCCLSAHVSQIAMLTDYILCGPLREPAAIQIGITPLCYAQHGPCSRGQRILYSNITVCTLKGVCETSKRHAAPLHPAEVLLGATGPLPARPPRVSGQGAGAICHAAQGAGRLSAAGAVHRVACCIRSIPNLRPSAVSEPRAAKSCFMTLDCARRSVA